MVHLLLCVVLLGLFVTWTFYLPVLSHEFDVYPGIHVRHGKNLLVGLIISVGSYVVYCVTDIASGLRSMCGVFEMV